MILIMDDFHNMGRNNDVGSEQYDFLRSLNETGLVYYWIVSDSDFSDVYATEQFTTSFFAQKFLPETMPQMSEEDILAMINDRASKLDLELHDGGKCIYNVIAGIPGLVDSAIRCYETFDGRIVDDDELIDSLLEFPKSQSLFTVWSRSLTSDQKELLIELAERERVYQNEYQERGIIGKINQLGDNSGLGLIKHFSDEGGVFWTLNSRVYREFINRKRDLFDGAIIKQSDSSVVENVTQNTYVQNNYYTVNNFFSADGALEALMNLKRLATEKPQLSLPYKDILSSAIQQLPFQQDGWESLDDEQKEDQASEYAEKIFEADEFKTDKLSENQMQRFHLNQGILDNISDVSRENLISAIQVYDLLQLCVDKFGLNMMNSESARGILFAKLYESILKESLKPALETVEEIASMKLILDRKEYLFKEAPAEIMTIGNFAFVLKNAQFQQTLGTICTFNIGREDNDAKWWKQHYYDIVSITNLRNDCCHSGNHFNAGKLDKLIKYLFEMGAIANVEIYNDIAERIILYLYEVNASLYISLNWFLSVSGDITRASFPKLIK